MAGLKSLLKRRQFLQSRIAAYAREMESIDKVLFPRFEVMVAAAEGLNMEVDIELPDEQSDDVDDANVNKSSSGPAQGRPIRVWGSTAGALQQATGGGDDKDWLEAEVRDILLSRGGLPMRAGDIYQELLERGKFVGGKSPVNNLSAHLSNREAFVSTSSGWKLKDPAPTPAQKNDGLQRYEGLLTAEQLASVRRGAATLTSLLKLGQQAGAISTAAHSAKAFAQGDQNTARLSGLAIHSAKAAARGDQREDE